MLYNSSTWEVKPRRPKVKGKGEREWGGCGGELVAGEMAQWVNQALVVKPTHLNPIPRIYLEERRELIPARYPLTTMHHICRHKLSVF